MNKIKKKKVLVTGMAGFIGFHLAKLLVKENSKPKQSLKIKLKVYFTLGVIL